MSSLIAGIPLAGLIDKLKLLLALLPQIIDAVKAAELLFGTGVIGNGSAKLDLVKSVLEIAFTAISPDAKARFDDVWPSIEKIVGNVVRLYNTFGWPVLKASTSENKDL